ncbi:MAG: diacylglycerol O-acyltransferase / trehalose O-mycolyltransferase [Solirubrobacterales bacterium]|jgi:S-formylglutathione hydrolase FrmB|nr:diacylglycerol O-acyltransferase / trehalose O-mycolyltransferase [Solirubrobacterales bacterium]
MRRGALVAALLVSTLLVCAAAPHAHASELTEITLPARNGEIADQWLPGYPGPPRARVLLPDGYDPAKPYPLLVLLAGLSSNYRVWSEPGLGQIAKTAAGFDGIIVMPEGGSGWYTDWWNGGKRSSPSWESYQLDEVIPQILERYRIRPERRYHALAGVSMGGLGTAYLGGRLPGFFGSIAILSGLVDGHLAPGQGAIQSLIPELYANASIDPEAVMGPENGFYSYGHDPMRLAANLRETRVYMTVGNGVPTSDGEPNPNNPVSDPPSEALIIRPASDHYAAALAAAGVDLTYSTHDGIHDWANFRPELRAAIAWGLFAPVDEHPTSWVNDTVATQGKLWEFGYRFDAPPDRIVRFRRAGEQLSVGAAGSPVTLTTDGGCVVHVATPAVIDVPIQPCAQAAVRPQRMRSERRIRRCKQIPRKPARHRCLRRARD